MSHIITNLLKYLFPEHKSSLSLYTTLLDLQATMLQIKESVHSPPPLLSTILNPGEKVFHMLRTTDDKEHVASAVWQSNRLVSEDIEDRAEFDSLSAFGEYHYKMVANNRRSSNCRGYKECYVVRDGKRYQLYELLP